MTLITHGYLNKLDRERASGAKHLPHAAWSELARALNGLLLGYFLCALCLALAVGLVLFLLKEVSSAKRSMSDGDLSTLLFAGGGVLVLISLASFFVLVRSKWRCLMHAPEEHGGKWWMFTSILCVLVGPSMNLVAPFLSTGATQSAKKAGKPSEVMTREIDSYKHLKDASEVGGYLKLAGSLASLLSTVFFVLFLRAVAQCLGSEWRARMCDGYLLLTVLLVGGVVTLLFGPGMQPASLILLLLALAGGQVLALLWYILLIISTSFGVAGAMKSSSL